MILEELQWVDFNFIFHGLGASAFFFLIPRGGKLPKRIDCFFLKLNKDKTEGLLSLPITSCTLYFQVFSQP